MTPAEHKEMIADLAAGVRAHMERRRLLYADGDFAPLVASCVSFEADDGSCHVVGEYLSLHLRRLENLVRAQRARLAKADDPQFIRRLDAAIARRETMIREDIDALLEEWQPYGRPN